MRKGTTKSANQNKINCAWIASYYGPYYSNFVCSMLSFEEEMKKRGNKTIYILPAEAENFSWIELFKKENATIYFIPYKPHSLSNVIQLRKIFKKEKINLIYSHMCGWDFTARFAAPFTPIIWHMHMRVLVSDWKHKLKNWLKFRIIGIGKVHHIAVSSPTADAINSLNPHNKCAFIPNALQFDRLGELPERNRNGEPYKLLIFGWAPIVKGLDIALDACESINQETVKVELIVSSQDKTYTYINERYKEIPEWLKLVPPTDKIAELYASVDCMVSASRAEGFSYAIAEAIYTGLPIVYSDIPGTLWTSDFESTSIFESGNPASLISAINRVMENGISLESQQNNRKKMEELYSMDAWVNQVMDVINSIKI